MDGDQAASTEDVRGGDGLLGRQDTRQVADRFSPTEARTVDRQERGVERAELTPDSPPVPVPKRVATMEDAATAGRHHPGHLRIAVAIRRRHRRGGEVAEQLWLP